MEFIQKLSSQGISCNYGITDRFKTSFLSVDFVLPLSEENASGMSLLAGVLFRGCNKYPQMKDISRYMARNYGVSLTISANKVGEMELLSFCFSYLDSEYAIDGEDIRGAVVSLFKELLFHPLLQGDSFVESYVEQEKTNLIDRITGLFNDKRVYSMERCKELMCKEEAYGINEMGSIEMVKSFTAASLYEFYKKLLNEAFVSLVYVGKDRESFLENITEEFDAVGRVKPETEVRYHCEAREIVEPMELNQSKLNLGFRLGNAAQKNQAACRLFNVLYGGSATSKLFMNVRERLSLCYYCSSTIDRFKNVMFVSSGVEASKYEEAKKEILAQLNAIVSGDFSEEEFQNAKAYLVDSVRSSLDSEGALASMMLAGTLQGDLKTPQQQIEEVEKVSREDVMDIAREVILDTVYFLKGVQHDA